MSEWIIQCPGCGCPGWLHFYEGHVSHHCVGCGRREIPPEQVALGGARYEALARTVKAAGMEVSPEIEPLYRKNGKWFGVWSRRERALTPVPEDEADLFDDDEGACL